MSDLQFNIRFGYHHLQIGYKPFKIMVHSNSYWKNNKPVKWFTIYTWFGKNYY
jgi:hypothetical protein